MAYLNLETDTTLEEIFHAFDFNFETGKVVWKNPPGYQSQRIGITAGTKCRFKTKYYCVIGFKDKRVFRSKLVWFAYHGVVSSKIIDHRDGDSMFDGISNLREVDYLQNAWNTKKRKVSKYGFPPGVRKVSGSDRKFTAAINHNMKRIYLGSFGELYR